MKLHKPGMRNIKTGIGVMICAIVGYLGIIDKVFFAAIACVVCMQTTVKSSMTVGLNRLKGTFIGGVVALIFTLILPGNVILSCLGIITTIYICNILKLNKSINIACIVYCAIYFSGGDANAIDYSIHRIIDTSVGVVIGVCVNFFIYRPNYLESIYKEIKIIEDKAINLLKDEIENGTHNDILSLKSEITKLEGLYKKFLEELEYSNDEFNDKKINNTIKRCNQIYLHLQVLEFMKDKCYLNKENYMKSKSIYDDLASDIEIKNDVSPVYNYHISMIIENINKIHSMNENIFNYSA